MEHNVNLPDVEKVKTHFRRNKKLYIGIGIGIGIGLVVFRRPMAPVFNNTNMVITDLSRRGHPGYIVKCNETGEVFASINRAAGAMGINVGNLVSHLKGTRPAVGGYTFEILGEAV